MAMGLNQFIALGFGFEGGDWRRIRNAQLPTRNSKLAADFSWHLHPDFLERVHFDGEADARLLVEAEAGGADIRDLADDNPRRENAAKAACGDDLAGDQLAVAGQIF